MKIKIITILLASIIAINIVFELNKTYTFEAGSVMSNGLGTVYNVSNKEYWQAFKCVEKNEFGAYLGISILQSRKITYFAILPEWSIYIIYGLYIVLIGLWINSFWYQLIKK